MATTAPSFNGAQTLAKARYLGLGPVLRQMAKAESNADAANLAANACCALLEVLLKEDAIRQAKEAVRRDLAELRDTNRAIFETMVRLVALCRIADDLHAPTEGVN